MMTIRILYFYIFQVRMKAMCVLEAVLRKKDDEHFLIVSSFFSENKDSVVSCSESPQASLREKAVKVIAFIKWYSLCLFHCLFSHPTEVT